MNLPLKNNVMAKQQSSKARKPNVGARIARPYIA